MKNYSFDRCAGVLYSPDVPRCWLIELVSRPLRHSPTRRRSLIKTACSLEDAEAYANRLLGAWFEGWVCSSYLIPQPGVLDFSNHLRRIFVLSESHELGMSQVIGPSPLQELDLCDYFRTQPNIILHFLRSKALIPPAGGQLREVSERAFRRLQVCNPFEDFLVRGNMEASIGEYKTNIRRI